MKWPSSTSHIERIRYHVVQHEFLLVIYSLKYPHWVAEFVWRPSVRSLHQVRHVTWRLAYLQMNWGEFLAIRLELDGAKKSWVMKSSGVQRINDIRNLCELNTWNDIYERYQWLSISCCQLDTFISKSVNHTNSSLQKFLERVRLKSYLRPFYILQWMDMSKVFHWYHSIVLSRVHILNMASTAHNMCLITKVF